jgi:Domain of unknown function (DUF3597)
MEMLNNLISRILGYPAPPAGVTPPTMPKTTIESATAPSATSPAASAVSPATAASASPAAAAVETIDVTAILDDMVARNSEKLDWKKSIIDLMKLVDMDSSLSVRKQLATELHYPGNQNDSATMNVWLHKQVLRQLSEHGARIPQELL